ncbi:uncharacterized protein si:dkeyp-118a3.2 [Hypomesus transpacificus]|uniref:uncharacterized protein si:dkeyp-118a3.2 n=1 Tax=Hypomesus transpacificus TaxID=137520 RepID=UPI001F08556E|nr:uncharacterized protein si:dkeyp-118a3.2 [Hypomesus transpacificus]
MGGDDNLVGEESNHDNEIFTSKDNLNLEPVNAAPTLDNLVEEIPATPPQPEEEEELGEPIEIGETSTNVSEGGLGLEAWKIGAISAAVFLVLETIVIVVYVLKCRNRSNSAPAPERACEEACVEAEPATGVCEDDTLLAGNGDAQQIAALDPSDLSQVVTQQQDVEEEEVGMTDIQLSSIEQSVELSQPASEQDLRTSVL